MENEIKELMSYMKEQKGKLQHLYEERISLKEEKDRIDDKDSGFYQDAEQEYNSKVEEYDNLVKQIKDVIGEKKKKIIERLEKDKKAIDKYRKEYKSEYVELSLMHEDIIRKREQLEGAKAHLKWLKGTLSEAIESNRETISKAEARVEKLEKEFDESIRIVNLIPEGKSAKETYIGLQEKIKNIEKLNMNNLQEVAPELVGEESKSGEGDKSKPGEGDKSKPGEGDKSKPGEGDKSKSGEGDKSKSGEGDKSKSGEGDKSKSGKGDKSKSGEGDKSKSGEGDKTKVPDSKKIIINAETGYVVYDEMKNGRHFSDEIDLDKVFSNKKLNKSIIEMLDKEKDKKYIKILKSKIRSMKLNPAILTILNEWGNVEDLKTYIDVVFDKEKGVKDLPFEYEANLESASYVIKNKTLNRLNRTLLRDNKELGTDFPATKYLGIKKFLSKMPLLTKATKAWIGLLPEKKGASKTTEEMASTIKAAKYKEYIEKKYPNNTQQRKTSKGYKEFVNSQNEYSETGDSKTAFSKQLDPNNPIYDKNRLLDEKAQSKLDKHRAKKQEEMTK